MVTSQFTLDSQALVRLIESPHEKVSEQLALLGGIEGIAAAIGADLRGGLASDQADLDHREAVFGKNYVPPPSAKSFLRLMWDAFKDISMIILTISGVFSIVLAVTVGDHPDTGWVEGACILLAVFVVSLVTAVNDYQKEQQFRALNAIKEDEGIKIIRDGIPAEVPKWNLLVGDIVRVELGDIIPADGIMFDGKDLKLDESAMTGESDLVTKNQQKPFLLSGTKVMEGLCKMLVVCVGENSQAGIIKNLISGRSKTKSTALKKSTEKQRPRRDHAEDDVDYVEIVTPKASVSINEPNMEQAYDHDAVTPSPLEIKLYNLMILLSKLGVFVALLVFATLTVHFSIETFKIDGMSWKSSYISDYLGFFITAITVLVVAIPEGLPLAVTIALAYSVKKMLADNNLVRHLDACETMGSATTICSDKTGTLTTNRMTVMKIWLGGQEFVSGDETLRALSESTKQALCAGISVNSTAEILPPKVEGGLPEHTGNKTECALLQFIRDGGVEYPDVRACNDIVHMITFTSTKKRMSVVVRRDGGYRIYTKGATEIVLGLCRNVQYPDGTTSDLNEADKAAIGDEVIERYASQGYRTLCLAYRDVDVVPDEMASWSDDDIERDLTCIAIAGIEDPVRPEVPDAIEICSRAGITVRMVTGDNITTARSIARKCGIIRPGDGSLVMEGLEFRSRVLDPNGNIIQSEFDKVWPMLRVLARSSPKDKYTLVTGLMQTQVLPHGRQVVAVTGDGTNDAPALKRANVGFAMGISGTGVTKDASDIILMDDNFNSIVNALKWGRNVYDSIAKFLQFQLTVNVVAIALAFVGVAVMEQSPLSATQMLWVNLLMDSIASLGLATELPTQELLNRKPYKQDQALLSKKMSKNILGQAVFQTVLLLAIVFSGDKWFGIKSGRYIDIPFSERNEPTQHMTIVFNTFVWCQLFNELNCRKIHDERNIFAGITKNRVYFWVILAQILLQIFVIEFTGSWFKCVPLSAGQWAACIGMGFFSLPVGLLLRSIEVKNVPNWMSFCREVNEDEVRELQSGRGLELWIRGLTRIRAQLRVIKAFRRGLEGKITIAN